MADAESKRWRVEMADKTTRTIEDRGFTSLMGGKFVSQGNVVSFTAPYGAWPYFTYLARGGSGGLVNMGQLSLGSGGYTCGHTNQADNDGTALMYPMANGTWP